MTWTHAGGVVFRDGDAGREYLVVRSSRGTEWVLPKGHIEAGETAPQAAVREVREEAAVDAAILAPLGDYAYATAREQARVQVFLMRAVGEVAATEQRARAWLPYREARARLQFEETRRLLDEADRRR